MAITVESFRLRFAEFADEGEFTDEFLQMFITDSVSVHLGTDEKRWLGRYDYAQAYLVAHHVILADLTRAGDLSGALGAVVSKTAGGVSISYASPKQSSSDSSKLSTTSYGQEFLSIRNSTFIPILVANAVQS